MNFSIYDESERPPIVNSKQELELLKKKELVLNACEECNHSGYLEGGVECDCLKSILFEYELLCSNIPERYRRVKFEHFQEKDDPGFQYIKKYCGKLDNARKKGIGVHLYTKKAGTGKTFLASCILIEAMRQGYSTWFTSLEQLIEDIKLGFTDKQKRDITEWAMFKADFLLIDEVAKFQKTDWRDGKINDMIQRRVNQKLPILTTENLSLEQLSEKFPDHLISRLIGTSIEVTFSHRVEFRRDVMKQNLMKDLME